MSFLARLAGSYVDAVLNRFYPLEREPSMADLGAERLADREAEEEVGTGGHVCRDDVWPEQPDPLGHIVALLEDIRNLLSSAVSPDAAESPGEAVPPAFPGHPDHNEEAASLVGGEVRWHRASLTQDLDYRCICGQSFPFKGQWRWHLSEQIADALTK